MPATSPRKASLAAAIALVAGSALLVWLVIITALVAGAVLAFFSNAWSNSREFSLLLYGGFLVVFLPACYAVVRLIRRFENRIFHDESETHGIEATHTRIVTLALIVGLPWMVSGGRTVLKDGGLLFDAFGARDEQRGYAAAVLIGTHPRLGCYAAERILRTPGEMDSLLVQAHMAGFMGSCPSATPTLIRLAGSPSADVRRNVGPSLARHGSTASDAVWAVMTQLAFHDPEGIVRRDTAQALIGMLDEYPASRSAEVIRMLRETPDPEAWVRTGIEDDLARRKGRR